jgi:hypothetical protein
MILRDFCLLHNRGSCASGPCKGQSAADVVERSLIQMLARHNGASRFCCGSSGVVSGEETAPEGRFANVRGGRSKHEEGYILDIGSG